MSADADCNETDMTAWLGKEEIMIDDFEGPAAVQALRDQVLRDRLNALAQYAPIFTAPGFEFASWQKYPPDEQGRIVVPECVLGPEARAFVATAYEFRWVVRAFNWSAWRNSAEAQGLLANPAHIAAASAEQLSKLLTGFIRNDKFCEGALLRAFEAGFLTAIVERASVISNLLGSRSDAV